MPAGYSKTPLVQKLGSKPNFKIYFANPPEHLQTLIGDLPENAVILDGLNGPMDYIQLFTKSKEELETQFPILKKSLAQNGMLWISWPKKAAKGPD